MDDEVERLHDPIANPRRIVAFTGVGMLGEVEFVVDPSGHLDTLVPCTGKSRAASLVATHSFSDDTKQRNRDKRSTL